MRHRLWVGLLGLAMLVIAPAAPAMAYVGLCAPYRVYGATDTVAAVDLNANILAGAQTNSIPSCISGYSANLTDMRATRDPFPASVESLASSLQDELGSLRFVLQKITGWTQWYKYTDATSVPTTLQAPALGVNVAPGATGTITATGALSLTGNTNQIVLGTTNTGTITMAALAASKTWTLPATTGTLITTGDAGTVTNTMLAGTVTVGLGGTGAITLTTNGVLYGNGTGAVGITAQGAANSILTANAGAPVFSQTPVVNTSLTLGVGAGTTGQLILKNATNANSTILQAGAASGALTWTLPTADGVSGQVIQTNGAGVLSFVNSATGSLSASGTLRGSGGTDYDTTSAAYADVDAVNLKVTVTVPTGAKFLRVWVSLATGPSAGTGQIQVLAAGTAVPILDINNGVVSPAGMMVTRFAVVANPTAGSQTISLQYKADGVNHVIIKNANGADGVQNFRAQMLYEVTN